MRSTRFVAGSAPTGIHAAVVIDDVVRSFSIRLTDEAIVVVGRDGRDIGFSIDPTAKIFATGNSLAMLADSGRENRPFEGRSFSKMLAASGNSYARKLASRRYTLPELVRHLFTNESPDVVQSKANVAMAAFALNN